MNNFKADTVVVDEIFEKLKDLEEFNTLSAKLLEGLTIELPNFYDFKQTNLKNPKLAQEIIRTFETKMKDSVKATITNAIEWFTFRESEMPKYP